MSHEIDYLHSHSGLERDLKFPKHTVLVDAEYAHLFHRDLVVPFKKNGVEYIKVNIMQFVRAGGVFSNSDS